jgi:predicted nucleotidyltransferase
MMNNNKPHTIDLSFIEKEYFKNKVRAYTDLILSQDLNIRGILLFGSVARGDEVRNQERISDIDLIVVCDALPDDLKKRRDYIFNLTRSVNSNIQALWWTSEDIKVNLREKIPLLLDALDEGKILYDEDNFLHKLRREMFLDLAKKGVIKTDMYWQWPIKKFGDKIEF